VVKRFVCVILVLMVISFGAFAEQPELIVSIEPIKPIEPIEPGSPITELDFVFVYEGGEAALGGDPAPFIDYLEGGAEWVYTRIANGCLLPGEDKEYENDEIIIATIPGGKNGADTIETILVIGGEWKTARGIGVGSTIADIETAYGAGFSIAYGEITLSAGDPIVSPFLLFAVDDGGIVTEWLIYRNTQV
jgi:hypothetical protein